MVVAAIACTDKVSASTYLLIIHNVLYIKEIKCNYIPPFIVRLAGYDVNKWPKFLSQNPTKHAHVNTITNTTPNLVILLSIKGITSLIHTRFPRMNIIHVYIMISPQIIAIGARII